ncbi:FAD-dependent monooxygenase [Streptomyces sp. NPDC004232]|uniref:FAD-dependent monooxygenase n=1 Tax=Streptomyces sp. NPDC004232 TaxID=3154454 RepID=UPI001D28EB76|nr:FAD-dependent monooxygenase [Streptomyces sp. tea 10]
MSSPPCEVLIVGGGPVGMLLAAELGAYGVATTVVEARRTTSDEPRAGTLHARTVQSLARRGLAVGAADSAGAGGEPFHFAGLPGLSITAPAAEPAVLVKRAQADLERHFEAVARERGVRVLRGHRAVRIDQDPGGVQVVVAADGSTCRLRASYVVGADGARSTVRELCGFAAVTHPATVSALMGQIRFTDPAGVPLGWQRTERGWTSAKCDGQGRGRLLTLDCRGPHPDRAGAPTLEELSAEAARIVGRPVPLADPVHLSRFSDFSRLVTGYRQGRIFLAGDSAHVHFPVGGQGLNTGLLDALNLGWKLAHALRGRAGKDLLDTYDRERRPAGQRVVDNTRAQLALMRPGPELDPLRALMADLLPLPEVARRLGGMVSAQDTEYRDGAAAQSVWEGRFLPNQPLAAGGTDLIALLGEGRPVLLLGDGADRPGGAEGWAHVLRTARAAGPLPDADAVVVRPDGYVLWASDGGELAGTLRQWFGEPREEFSRPAVAGADRSADLSRCLMGYQLEFL